MATYAGYLYAPAVLTKVLKLTPRLSLSPLFLTMPGIQSFD
jgi:hypothetical protein